MLIFENSQPYRCSDAQLCLRGWLAKRAHGTVASTFMRCTKISFTLLSVLFATPFMVAASELSKMEATRLCAAFKAQYSIRSMWASFDRVPFEGNIELGVIDKSNENGEQEYVPAENRYRLILGPARLTVSDQCSMSLCISFKKTKPICPNTTEYVVEFSALPSKFGPGPFSTEERLIPEDPKADYPLDTDLLTGKTLSGTIFMPWLTVEKSKSDSPSRNGNTNKVEEILYVIRNTGNRSLSLGNWEKVEGSNPAINIADSTCAAGALSPGATCSFAFRITPAVSKIKKHTSFTATSADDRVTFTLYANFNEEAEFSVTIKNQ